MIIVCKRKLVLANSKSVYHFFLLYVNLRKTAVLRIFLIYNSLFMLFTAGNSNLNQLPCHSSLVTPYYALCGVVLIAISHLWGDNLLRLIGATDANLSLAHDYGFIIYAMIPLALVQNTLASIIRADGSPRYAMCAMLVGAVINIICLI